MFSLDIPSQINKRYLQWFPSVVMYKNLHNTVLYTEFYVYTVILWLYMYIFIGLRLTLIR